MIWVAKKMGSHLSEKTAKDCKIKATISTNTRPMMYTVPLPLCTVLAHGTLAQEIPNSTRTQKLVCRICECSPPPAKMTVAQSNTRPPPFDNATLCNNATL